MCAQGNGNGPIVEKCNSFLMNKCDASDKIVPPSYTLNAGSSPDLILNSENASKQEELQPTGSTTLSSTPSTTLSNTQSTQGVSGETQPQA